MKNGHVMTAFLDERGDIRSGFAGEEIDAVPQKAAGQAIAAQEWLVSKLPPCSAQTFVQSSGARNA